MHFINPNETVVGNILRNGSQAIPPPHASHVHTLLACHTSHAQGVRVAHVHGTSIAYA